ncbi:hypothetical protein [Mesorhizobium sp. B1-1-7]|uniref:hypothetical protein n=1 Tax=Mesorhizobium sp. B1-1-7 TaxID=2589977 RepID=UPI001FEDCAD1|nr:hypothetical protein [Mesorhizobium sp. B1-1-7]
MPPGRFKAAIAIELDIAGSGKAGGRAQRAAAETEIARSRAEIAVGGHLKCPGVDHRAAAIGVGAGQDRRSAADLADRASAADNAAIGQRVAAVEGEHAGVGDVADDRAAGATISQLQRALLDIPVGGRRAIACQHPGAGARLLEGVEIPVLGRRADGRDIETAVSRAAQAQDVVGTERAADDIPLNDRRGP